MQDHAHAPTPFLPVDGTFSELIPPVQDVLHKAMEKDREERYQKADELSADIEKILRGASSQISAMGASKQLDTQSSGKRTRPKRVVVAILSAVLLLGVVAAASVLMARRDPHPSTYYFQEAMEKRKEPHSEAREAAAKMCEKALALDKVDNLLESRAKARCYHQLASALYLQGNGAEAEAYTKRAVSLYDIHNLEIDHHAFEALTDVANYADEYSYKRRESARLVENVVNKHSRAHLWEETNGLRASLARIYANVGDLKTADVWYERITETERGNVMWTKATLEFQRGRLKEAETFARLSLGLKGFGPSGGDVYAILRRVAIAEDDWKKFASYPNLGDDAGIELLATAHARNWDKVEQLKEMLITHAHADIGNVLRRKTDFDLMQLARLEGAAGFKGKQAKSLEEAHKLRQLCIDSQR